MLCDIALEDPRWSQVQFDERTEAAARAVLQHLDLDPDAFEISVLACDDARIATLNAEFRDRPTATNVLSWPSAERGASEPGGVPLPPGAGPFDAELGDIAISYDTCAAEATAADKAMADHVSHLIVHGVLHLLGYDHVDDADAALMEQIEVRVLEKLGIADPYTHDDKDIM